MISREWAKNRVENSGHAMWALSDVFTEIDKIYDSIGTCRECRYCISDEYEGIGGTRLTYLCNYEDSPMFEVCTYEEWYCADFERKAK